MAVLGDGKGSNFVILAQLRACHADTRIRTVNCTIPRCNCCACASCRCALHDQRNRLAITIHNNDTTLQDPNSFLMIKDQQHIPQIGRGHETVIPQASARANQFRT
jgi:hypothetical protein